METLQLFLLSRPLSSNTSVSELCLDLKAEGRQEKNS